MPDAEEWGIAVMTEQEWFECISPERMLAHLGERASARKKRLFASACVRRIRSMLTDERLRKGVELAERFADGKIDGRRLRSARHIVRALRRERQEAENRRPTWKARAARSAAQAVEALLAAKDPLLEMPRDIRDHPDVVSATRTARASVRAIAAQIEEHLEVPPVAQPPGRLETLDAVDLLREIFGNPFRPIVIDPAWLIWKKNRVARMARAIYDQRRFRKLPILADTLEAAGCTDAGLLTHCRARREHVRGCWVVDALLGID